MGKHNISARLLKKILRQHNTAIVLGDESLLIPMLNSLPKGIKDVNITMGFPLFSSSVSSLFYKLFKLHINSSCTFYYKEVVSILSHELIKPLFNMKMGIIQIKL